MKKPPMSCLWSLLTWTVVAAMLGTPQADSRGQKAAQPELTTDRSSYMPGSVANIIGSGFLPGEEVQLQVLHADGTSGEGQADTPWAVQANARGDFLTSWEVCEEDCLGLRLQLVARDSNRDSPARRH